MNLVLIGYRGTGKSTVGRMLASRLKRRLISSDAEIVRRAGESIPDIVKRAGWDGFRDLESKVLLELSAQDNLIIDTGGGAILRPENVEALRRGGRLFWLTATVDTIRRRIRADTQRPSLTGKKSFLEEITEVLAEREPKYRAAAHEVVPTDGRTAADVVQAILERFQAAGC
jgi:shikimate kinase